jgi:hypothetical protein
MQESSMNRSLALTASEANLGVDASRMGKRDMHRVLILMPMIIVLFVAHMLYLRCVAEDSYITFRFAKNWVAGHGLTWNVGEAPVEGYTNFLWVVLCAVSMKLGLDVVLVVQAVGVLASIGTLVYVYLFMRRVLQCSPLTSCIPPFFLAISGPFATWASSGMETNAFGFFLFLSCYHFASYWNSSSPRALILSFASVLVATLLRPEGFMIFGLLLGMSWLFSPRRLGQTLRDLAVPLAVYVLPFIVYFLWRLSYYGDLLPNTFYAKTGGTIWQYLRGSVYLGFFCAYFVLPLLLLPFLHLWENVPPRLRSWRQLRGLRQHARGHVGVWVSCIILATYFTYIVWVGGDYMAMYRFVVPVLPFVYILFGTVADSLFRSIVGAPWKGTYACGALLFAALATVVPSTPLEQILFHKPPLQNGHFRGVILERWSVARLIEIGKFFNRYKRDASERLATDAIGAISYYADLKILDRSGLADRHIARQTMVGKALGQGLPGHEKEDLDYTFKRLPTYFMFSRKLLEEPLGIPIPEGKEVDLADVVSRNYKHMDALVGFINNNRAFIHAHYTLAAVWIEDEVNGEKGYFTFLERKRS